MNISGWILDGQVGHVVKLRGPTVIECWCGRSVPGSNQVTEVKPPRICGDCVKAARRDEERRRAKELEQGRLF